MLNRNFTEDYAKETIINLFNAQDAHAAHRFEMFNNHGLHIKITDVPIPMMNDEGTEEIPGRFEINEGFIERMTLAGQNLIVFRLLNSPMTNVKGEVLSVDGIDFFAFNDNFERVLVPKTAKEVPVSPEVPVEQTPVEEAPVEQPAEEVPVTPVEEPAPEVPVEQTPPTEEIPTQ